MHVSHPRANAIRTRHTHPEHVRLWEPTPPLGTSRSPRQRDRADVVALSSHGEKLTVQATLLPSTCTALALTNPPPPDPLKRSPQASHHAMRRH
jgi:hypothetical protein